MGRTNIEIDDALIQRVMELYHLPTKRAAVEFALEKLANPPSWDKWKKLEGTGWIGDLPTMRGRPRKTE